MSGKQHPHPHQGGSYTRQADGSLKRTEEPTAQEPQANEQRPAPAKPGKAKE